MGSSIAQVFNVQNFVNLRQELGFSSSILEEVRKNAIVTLTDNKVYFFGSSQSVKACNDICSIPGGGIPRYLEEDLDSCFQGNTMWYKVRTQGGNVGFVSGKFLRAIQ